MTTHAIGAPIQQSPTSLSRLIRELGIKPMTVVKWRKQVKVENLKTELTEPRSKLLPFAEAVLPTVFRRHKLLTPDSGLYALHLTTASACSAARDESIPRRVIAQSAPSCINIETVPVADGQ